MEREKIVWRERGFIINCEDIQNEQGSDETFFSGKTLEKAMEGFYTKTEVWLTKFDGEYKYYIEEYNAVEFAEDFTEDEKERKILQQWLKELKGEE